MTDNTDVFKVLARADGRWATKQADDPADPEYLRHLAAAVEPLTGQAAPAPIDAGVADQLADTAQALEAARAARDTATNQLRVTQTDLADTLALLGRLVDAVTTQWQPQGDIPAQVDHAIDLVNAASDQLNARHDAGRHVHQYPLANSRYGSCDCGKPYPRTATKTGLTAPKGDAA